MASNNLPVIEVKPLQKGTEGYEKKRAAIIDELAAKIPQQYHLSEGAIGKPPPLDVTGIPRSCGILTKEELAITEDYDAVGLAEAIAHRRLSAVDVATAFSKRAAVAHQLSCCLTDWFMDEAIERAKYLDDYLQKHGKPIGPLHGVPIRVKEHVTLKGHYSSWGFLATRTFSEEDCLLIRSKSSD